MAANGVAGVGFVDYRSSIVKALDIVDAVGTELLGHDPQRIEYLKPADGILGSMEYVEVVTIEEQGCSGQAGPIRNFALTGSSVLGIVRMIGWYVDCAIAD